MTWPIVDSFSDLLEEVARLYGPTDHLKKQGITAACLLARIIGSQRRVFVERFGRMALNFETPREEKVTLSRSIFRVGLGRRLSVIRTSAVSPRANNARASPSIIEASVE